MIFSSNRFAIYLSTFLLILPLFTTQIFAQNETCLDCHEDQELTLERDNKEISIFVNADHYGNSVHADLECIDCHTDFDPEEDPHKEGENIYKVDCSECHDTEEFTESIHGLKNVPCADCHSKHNILEASELKKNQNELCISCHKKSSINIFSKSVHGNAVNETGEKIVCTDCHSKTAHNINSAQFSAQDKVKLCGECHQDATSHFNNSLHGKALIKNKFLAPNCTTCHGTHNVFAATDDRAKNFVMKIPQLCGDCHKEGTPVSKLRNVDQDHILENYAESMHGEGLLKRGLIVTAVCTSCHFSHQILPHEDPNSSINKNNIASTCMQCHRNIESVHTKVIKGELWEKEPHKIPACIDCHQPHKVRRAIYDDDYTNDLCMSCHSKKNLSMDVNGEKKSLFVDINKHNNSAHKDNSCIKCHTNISSRNNPVCLSSGKVDCASCHNVEVDDYKMSTHGTLMARGNSNAPYCNDCHEVHNTKKKNDLSSPTFAKNIPDLCGKCHREDSKEREDYTGNEHNVVANYSMSIHGKGLLKSGLLVTAKCTDCHTTHRELPVDDPNSSIHADNIAQTCATCHLGIYEEFKSSVHSPSITKTDKILPKCNDCHLSHTIERVGEDDFRGMIINQCGKCHEEVTETYFETFHGKVSRLGSVKTAKCYDCHGAHNILPPTNPNSTLSRKNVVNTCKPCHPNSNKMFVGYLTHATHHDKDKYPILYWTFMAMTTLLTGTFLFFGMHTLMWLPRALAEKKKHKKMKSEQLKAEE